MNKIKKSEEDELIILRKEFILQKDEEGKRAEALEVANKKIKELEALLQNNFKELSDYKYGLCESSIVAITDQKGIITKVNNNFCLISKYSEEELIGQDHRIINSGYHDKEFMRDLWLTIANGKIWKGELKNKAKDGTFYWVDTTIIPFLNDIGKPYQHLALRTDITARKKAEEYLIQRTAQLETANKELVFQHEEKEKRAAELNIANIELAFQEVEKGKRAAELGIANIELAFQDEEKGKRAAELGIANIELAFQDEEKGKRAAELDIANIKLAFQNKEKEKRAAELSIVNIELAFQNDQKEKRAQELIVANQELAFQNEVKEKRAAELVIANEELFFQNDEKEKRAAELNIANIELAYQNDEKEKRAAELSIANKELAFQNEEKEKRAAELSIANQELAFQNKEKEKRAAELIIANKELAFQNDQKEKRAQELIVANQELAYQNNVKEKRAAELIIANEELAYQNHEKEKRAAELNIANIELAYQNDEKGKRAAELSIANIELAYQNDEKEKRAAELSVANKELAYQNEVKEKRAAELIIANKELEAFTYVSSHDLQEPLRKIQIFASILLEDENLNLSDNGKYNFQRIQSAARRMQQLIEDLLAFSRINTTERKFEKTDLNIIIEEVKIDLKDTIQEKHATIEATEICPGNIIAFQFSQLMYNLISNALKFSNPDIPPHIVITSRIVKGSKFHNKMPALPAGMLSPEKNYCHITVKDNGIGFEPHFSKRIFEVFQKLHSKEEYTGTGIGLAIVKKIVENHNGIIIATSELNKGARFDIYIPDN